MGTAGDAVDETRRRKLPVVLHVVGGFLTGGLIGYVAAFVLPRRRGADETWYQAPIPVGHEPSSPALDLLAERVVEGSR